MGVWNWVKGLFDPKVKANELLNNEKLLISKHQNTLNEFEAISSSLNEKVNIINEDIKILDSRLNKCLLKEDDAQAKTLILKLKEKYKELEDASEKYKKHKEMTDSLKEDIEKLRNRHEKDSNDIKLGIVQSEFSEISSSNIELKRIKREFKPVPIFKVKDDVYMNAGIEEELMAEIKERKSKLKK